MTSYYEKNKEVYMKELKHLAPEQLKAFIQFERKVFRHGALSKKDKEIIAVAIAHVTGCPYCIDVHTKKAKMAGATLTELSEAIFVVIAIEGDSILPTSFSNEQKEEEGSDLYSFHLNELNPEGFDSFVQFHAIVRKDGNLSQAFKELIAVAVSYVTQNSISIKQHTKNALECGVTKEQIAEAIMVAVALKAGNVYSHFIHLMDSYQE